MTFNELRRSLSPAYWIAVAVVAVLVVFFLWWLFTEPGRARRDAAEARADSAFAGSAASSARDAGGTAAAAGAREWTTDQQAKEAEDEIRAANPDDQYSVALRAHCMRDASRDDPACVGVRRSRP